MRIVMMMLKTMMALRVQKLRKSRCIMVTLCALALMVHSTHCCPRPCSCPQPGEIHCTFRSMLAIPAGLPRQVERLNFGFNSISRISDSSFAGMRKLELLLMHSNNIHNIPNGAFRDLVSLQMMKISYNKLKVVSRHTFQGLWSLTRLHLDHNHLEFIHPDAFQGLTSLRLLQLEGNRLQQLHPATFATLSVLDHFPMSTLKHLYLSENGLTTIPQKMLAGMPYLENLFLHDNPWTCDCRMKWFKEWNSNAPGLLKCKKDKTFAGGQLCPMCFSPKQEQRTNLQELDNLKCTSPTISAPHRTPDLDTEREPMTLSDFQQPLGNVSLALSDEHGNQVDLNCHVNEPTESTRISWDHFGSTQIHVNVTLTLDLECPIDRSNYEKLWRLIAYYSDVPAHLKREMMLSKDPHMSYRYRQDVEKDAVYYTGVKANVVAQPAWIMQSAVELQLNRAQSTSKRVKLILGTCLSQTVEADAERHLRRTWVMIESGNKTRVLQTVVVGSPVQLICKVHSSGNPLIKWMLPNGSKIDAPFKSNDNRVTVSPSGPLTISSVGHSDSGVYYCIAQVMGDISVLPFRLTVEESSNPEPGVGAEGVAVPRVGVAGKPVSLPCVSTGSPDPNINWILPDSSIINTWTNSSRITLASNGTLTIRYSQLSDSGYYKCVAENQHGKDAMATKVTLTRPSTGQPVRKYSSRPQPAEGVSTKIIPLIDNDIQTVEASGDNDNEATDAKSAVGQVNTSNKLRHQYVPVRGGHPSRKVWRRPPFPRRRINSSGLDRTNTTEPRRRINVSNGQIDPERWASILAKVRNGGSGTKTTTAKSYIHLSTSILPEPETSTPNLSGSVDGSEGLLPVYSTMEAMSHETSYTVAEESVQTTVVNLDIKPLDSEDQSHDVYQIAAPDVDHDTDLYSHSSYATQTTMGTQPTTQLMEDLEKWNQMSTAPGTTYYATPSAKHQTHNFGSKLNEAIQMAEVVVDDDDGNFGNKYSLAENSRHGFKAFQEKSDESMEPTTSAANKLQNTKSPDAQQVTDKMQTATQEKHKYPQIPLYTTVTPRTTSTTRAYTTSVNLVPPIHHVTSSNSRRKNGGRRKRPKIRMRPSSSKATYFQSLLPQTTTDSSEYKIPTTLQSTSTESNFHTTLSSDRSSRKLSRKKNKNNLYTGKKNRISDYSHIQSSYTKPLVPMSIIEASTFTALGFTLQSPSTMDKELVSTWSPLTQRSPTGHWTLVSSKPLEGIYFKDKTDPAIRPSLRPDTSPMGLPSHPGVIPSAGSKPAKNSYIPAENKNVSLSTEAVKVFTVKSFSLFPTNNHESEIPSDSSTVNLIEVMTEKLILSTPSTQQSGMATTVKPSTSSVFINLVKEATSHKKLGLIDVNVPLKEDLPIATLKPTPTTPGTIPPAVIPLNTPTTSNIEKPPFIFSHIPIRNTSLSWAGVHVPDGPNHIPDRHQDRIPSPDQKLRPVIQQTSDRNISASSVFSKLDTTADIEFGTKKPIPHQTDSLGTQEPHVPQSRLAPPPKPHNTPLTVHYSQNLPVVPAEGGQPKITSTDIKTVTVWAESDAYLPCVAVGVPSPLLSWTKIQTGASIAQNTKIQRFEVNPNGTLIIRKALLLDRGQYLCKVQNQFGEAKMIVTLTVLAEPPRVLQPRYRDISKQLGDTVELPCQSHGQPRPHTTWVLPNRLILHMDASSSDTQEKRLPLSTSDSSEQRISVLANGTLRITSSSYTDRGIYKCIASNTAGADTITVRLTVAALPPIIQQPRQENLTFIEGSTVYLNCSATGAPNPMISWSTPDGKQLHPLELVGGRKLFVYPNGTLQIRGLAHADAGKYECTAASTVGISSRALRLTVKKSIASARARITFSSPPKTDVVYGGRLQLDCVASGDPEPRVIWKTPLKKLVDAHYSYDPRIKVFINGSLCIHSVTEKEEGDYLCVARNKVGDDYVPLKVSVMTKAAKIEQRTLMDQKVIYGGDLKVDCVASGLPNPKIQWSLPDGTMINSIMKHDGAASKRRYVVFENGTLFFNDVGMHEEGDYICYAENQIGKDEMKVNVKVLADVPVIKNGTFEVTKVLYGEVASLKCSAKGEPHPHILWFSPASKAIPSASSKYLIHNDGTLVIQNVQRFDGGNYTCLARNNAGQARKVSKLEILVSPPTINGLGGITNTLKVSALRGERKLLHCESTGIPSPQIMWVLPENVILPAPFYGSQMTVHRNGTLEIHSVKSTDEAKLTCVARNAGGEARLTVQLNAPDLIEKPKLRSPKTEYLSLTVGKTLTLNCSVQGSPTPQLTWVLPNGATLMIGSHSNKFYHQPNGSLVISNPALSEAGTYRCLGRNAGGMVDRTVVLAPGRKPEINNRYNSPISVMNGENLQLHCVSASDPVRVTWTLPSGVVLNRPQRAGRYAVLTNGTLSIQQASVYDRGSYTCRAANEYGSSLLTISVAIIAYSPRVTSGLAPTTYARRGVAVQLNCAASGIPKPDVTWETPDRTRLIVSPEPRLYGNKYLHPQGFLIIQNPMPKDTGLYRCTARNVIGVDSKGTYLHVF